MKRHIHTKWDANNDPCVLHLDSNFKPLTEGYLELKNKQFTFKGGEPHFQILEENIEHPDKLVITQRFNKIDDLVMIVLANDAAKRMGFKDIQLILPYFPAARQDRVCNVGEPLTIKVFADMINACGFSKVFTYAPHSEVAPALINNCEVLDLDFIIMTYIIEEFNDAKFNIVSPDAGAEKRVLKLVNKLNTTYKDDPFAPTEFNFIRCGKVRDVVDGSLKEFIVQSDDLGGFPTIIVDDVCAMGGTFIGLGGELNKKNAGKTCLFTSHADCEAGVQNMCNYFDKYYTTNSKQNWDDIIGSTNLKCFNLADLI